MEHNFKEFEKKAIKHWKGSLLSNEESLDGVRSTFARNAVLNTIVKVDEHYYIKEFFYVGHEYETALYTNFIYFIQNELNNLSIISGEKELTYKGFRQSIYRWNNKSSILLNYSVEKLNINTINILHLLENNLKTRELKEIHLQEDN